MPVFMAPAKMFCTGAKPAQSGQNSLLMSCRTKICITATTPALSCRRTHKSRSIISHFVLSHHHLLTPSAKLPQKSAKQKGTPLRAFLFDRFGIYFVFKRTTVKECAGKV